MKKAIIVTVYNSENCGSFLQAFALMKTMESLGFEVAFLRRIILGTSHDARERAKEVIRQVVHLKFTSAYYLAKRWLDFERVQKKFRICEQGDSFFNEAELVILGSDTIWNFADSYFSQHVARFLGVGIIGKHIISYAASIGNTSLETFQKAISTYGCLDNIASIMVRDNNTKFVVELSTKRKAEVVCDPTLLVTPIVFSSLSYEIKLKDYLLLYFFDEPSKELKNHIINFAKKEKVKIISLLTKRDWCDIFVPSSPSAMVSYYNNAKYIITNTFHGCALSLLYGKRFAVHEEGKVKVAELLKAYQQLNHLFISPNEMVSKLLDVDPVDNSIIKAQSVLSLKNLKRAII